MKKNDTFSIFARTSTLKYNNDQDGNSTILGNNTKYIIPIYQRPYSWTEEQIKKFLTDIFLGYWGNDYEVIKEPMFIGTMQLGKKNDLNEQDVIDGQQRLTTILILLKILKTKKVSSIELEEINLDWLETKVNNEIQQKDFKEFLEINSIEHKDFQHNKYIINAKIISDNLDEIIISGLKDGEENLSFDYNDFINYVLSKIYFVVIETHASLSKTLKIFNAINTTGLDLNGGDIFKLKMYEYLCDKNKNATDKNKNDYFIKVSSLYEKIDIKNKEYNLQNTIFGVLEVYKYIIVAKYDLPKTLYFYETNRFFEELFDTISNSNNWQNFKSVKDKNVEISTNDIDLIIDSLYQWDIFYRCSEITALHACSWHFIWWSRYSRFHILTYLFVVKFNKEIDFNSKLSLFNTQVSKLFIIYSIRYQKLKSEIYYTFMFEVLDCLVNKSYIELMKLINDKIGNVEDHRAEYYNIEEILNGNIVYNSKLKNIVCRLSALLEEDFNSTDKNICEKIFSSLDIEHIQSYNDIEGNERENIWQEWGNDINSIGNLMLLEGEINKSISNNSYNVKTSKERNLSYHNSNFKIVQKQLKDFEFEWNHQDCIKRKETEVKKILEYLFDKS